ncbi:hypothetical protein P7K49_025087, partial [Saguinus oedipus]
CLPDRTVGTLRGSLGCVPSSAAHCGKLAGWRNHQEGSLTPGTPSKGAHSCC